MTDNATNRNRDSSASTSKKLDELYKLIDGIEIAMFTPRHSGSAYGSGSPKAG